MKRFVFAIALLLLVSQPGLRAQLTYNVVDLGTLGGMSSVGNGVNDSGQVAGASYLEGDGAQNGFFTGTNGALPLRNLGTLGGSESFAQAINSSVRIAGISRVAGDTAFHAFLSKADGGVLGDLGTLGGVNSYGYGVNGAGQVAGYSAVAGSASRAFLSDANGGVLHDLGVLTGGTSSFAFAVNASGQVTGYSGTASGFNHAFISETNGGALRDLGTLGGRFSFGTAINDSGQVTGRSEPSGTGQHAFRSGPNGGALLDLSTLGGFSSFGEGINSAGAVVGYSYLSDNSTQRAFLFTTANGMRDLNGLLVAGSGWILTDAHAINDHGQITGVGTFAGKMHAFLLTPVVTGISITSVGKSPSGHFLVRGIGGPFQNHGVEATANLGEPFVRIATIVAASDGTLEFEDVDSGAFQCRFYRFVYP